MTTATLGFEVDSSPIKGAVVELDKFINTAVKTDHAVENLETATRGLGIAMQGVGKGAGQVKPVVDDLGRSFGAQDDHVKAFRMELERLTLKFQPMAQATRNYEAAVGEINRAHQLGVISAQQMQKALDAERLAYDRLRQSANSAGQAVQAANQNRGGAQGFNAANAGYQFQDIAVTAAMGMNPLMIGLQQGTQLAAVVGSMERPVAGLASAFGMLLGPVSLVTIGLTAGAAALIQYVSSWSGGDEINGDLAKQNELITRVAERWGDATPALKAYADELVRAGEARERIAAGEASAAAEFRKVEDVLGSINQEYTTAVRALRGYGEEAAPTIQKLTSSFTTLQSKILEGKASTDDLTAVQNALSSALEQSGTPAVQKLLDVFTQLVPQIKAATKAAADFRKEGSGSVYPDLGQLQGPWSEGGRMFFPEQFIPRGNIPVPQSAPNREDMQGPDYGWVMNPDGRMVPPGVPTRRPNYFERENDLPQFGSFRTGQTYWAREVLEEEQRRAALGGMFNGFFTEFGNALQRNGGDLGDALGEAVVGPICGPELTFNLTIDGENL